MNLHLNGTKDTPYTKSLDNDITMTSTSREFAMCGWKTLRYNTFDVWEARIYNARLSDSAILNLTNHILNPATAGDDCDYSGSGNWVINEDCHVDTNTKLESGYTLFVTAGHTAWVDSGVTIS